MAKYIDVDALKKEIDGRNRPEINDGSEEVNWLCKCIRTAPVVNIRPARHGLWIYQEPDDAWTYKPYLCSVCGEKGGKHTTEFCPHCGAKMDGIK